MNWGNWLFFALPFALVLLVATFFVLVHRFVDPSLEVDVKPLQNRLLEMGEVSRTQKIVIADFSILFILWLFRDPGFINDDSGWVEIFPSVEEEMSFMNTTTCEEIVKTETLARSNSIGDAVPAMFCALILFFVPSEHSPGGKANVLEWKTVERRLNWGSMWLIAGGLGQYQALS